MTKSFPRLGSWVILGGAVGVIAKYPFIKLTSREEPDPENEGQTMNVPVREEDPSRANVHLVDEKGETAEEHKGVLISELQQAKIKDIPEPRRPDPTKLDPSLGYHDKEDLKAHAEARKKGQG